MDKGLDGALRQDLLNELREYLASELSDAEASDAIAANAEIAWDDRDRARLDAEYNRRKAAHYQQAIDLLKASPMPPKDEPR